MSLRIGAIVMGVLLLLYLGVVAGLAVRLIAVDDGISRAIGVALIVLPLLGLWALVAEFLFGLRSQRLAAVLRGEGGLPGDSLPRRPSGRPVRGAADAEFPRYRDAVEREPDSWRAWLNLGLSYDAAGDRRRARQAVRRAIRLSRGKPAE